MPALSHWPALTSSAEPFRKFGKRVLAFGEAASIVEQDLGSLVPVERMGSSFEEVMDRARRAGRCGAALTCLQQLRHVQEL